MAAKKPTMAQAYKAAAKPKDKGIVGEGKDVLDAAGNLVRAAGNSGKQQLEFGGAIAKGAAKGVKAVAKGAEKVAGKAANVTVGDIYSAPLDAVKNATKGVKAVVGAVVGAAGRVLVIVKLLQYGFKLFKVIVLV